MYRRHLQFIRCINIGPDANQNFNTGGMAFSGCHVKWCLTSVILCINIRPLVDKHLKAPCLTIASSEVKGSLAIWVICYRHQIRPVHCQSFDAKDSPKKRGKV
eukprot:GDKK01042499.1.p2 GENE.GDKK01042499.1~~GDKK01042499.1.p2  ORF type:complete len:103 (-),score=5.03 GDKK01042499.1:258-566(-)